MEKNNKILPSLRISTSLDNVIKECLKVLNQNSKGIKITRTDMRRSALEFFATQVIEKNVELQYFYKKNGKV